MFKFLFGPNRTALLAKRAKLLADFKKAAIGLKETADALDSAIVETKEEVERLKTHMEQLESESKACLWSQRKLEEMLGE